MTAALSAPHFHDEDAARQFLESLRWPDGPVCPHCGERERVYRATGRKAKPGRHRCGNPACRKDFTVTVGTVFERSHIPLHKWLMACHLMAASKKGISAHQLHRILGVTYKSAWFLAHRIREAMSDGFFAEPMGGAGKVVEADETFWGNEKAKPAKARGYEHKMKVLSLVERDGTARSFHVASLSAKTLTPILKQQIAADTRIMTDEAGQYLHIGRHFAGHESVRHGRGEYVRGPIHTNTVEAYFSLLKRGLTGTYHHVSPAHLKRYVGEFDFRWNTRALTDAERAGVVLKGIEGKRLLYGGSASA